MVWTPYGFDENGKEYDYFVILMNIFFAIRLWAFVAMATHKFQRVSFNPPLLF